MRALASVLSVMTACMISGCSACGGGGTGGGGGGAGDAGEAADGDGVDWDLPELPSLAEEQEAIAPTLAGMTSALAAGDAAAATQWMAPEAREAYAGYFAQTPELMPLLATALESAQLQMVAEDDRTCDSTPRRIGDVEVAHDGIVFHATVVKVDGTWLFLTL